MNVIAILARIWCSFCAELPGFRSVMAAKMKRNTTFDHQTINYVHSYDHLEYQINQLIH